MVSSDERKLFNVTIEVEVGVVAKDADEAEEVARRATRDYAFTNELDTASVFPYEATTIPSGWNYKELPYGDNPEEDTVKEWLDRTVEQRKVG